MGWGLVGSGLDVRVGAEVAGALGDFRLGGLPVVLVFDRDVSGEAVFADFVEDFGELQDAGAEGAVVGPFGDGCAVLQVEGEHARRDLADDFEGVEAGGGPVADVGAETDAFVAVLDHVPDGFRVPEGGGFRVVVEADLDVVLLGEFFEGIDGTEAFGGDAVEAEGFGELEGDAGLCFVLVDIGDAEIDGGDAVFFGVFEDHGDLGGGFGGIQTFIAERAADFLAGEDFDGTGACTGGEFDGFEEGELLEGPALHGNGEAGGGEGWLRDGCAFGAQGQQDGGGGDHGEEIATFHDGRGDTDKSRGWRGKPLRISGDGADYSRQGEILQAGRKSGVGGIERNDADASRRGAELVG